MKHKKLLTLLILIAIVHLLSACQTDNGTMNHGNMMDSMPCHQMPNGEWMGQCDSESMDTEVESTDLVEAKGPSILDVSDGDTIDIRADIVKKTIAGREFEMYAYNGHIPGIILRAEKGDQITVNFENTLNEDTTIHWHGLRHDIKDDGVPGISQPPVKPGKKHTYTVYFPDEGMYWYHPHIREDRQQDLGLAGIMLVQPRDENYYNRVSREEVLVLDDFLSYQQHGQDHANHALMGRFGDTLLINGDEEATFEATKGDVIRIYIANVANVRPFNISIPNARVKLIGSDLGLYEKETIVESVIISPAERYIIEVAIDESGTYDILHVTPGKSTTIGSIVAKDSTQSVTDFSKLRTSTRATTEIAEFEEYFDKEPDYTLDLTIDMGEIGNMMNNMPCHQMGDGMWMGDCDDHPEAQEEEHSEDEDHAAHGIEWEDTMNMMNVMTTSENIKWKIKDRESGAENMDLTLKANIGEPVKIRLFNDPNSEHPMQHPIHLHGQRFVVTHVNGEANDNKVWKDTTLVLPGQIVDILVDVTNPGEWMIHCHIAEHLESGMMTTMIVE